MKFAQPRRRQPAESIVPMINVVFLLLIFFMMSATITQAPPFDLTLPETQAKGEVTGDQTLYLSAQGTVGYDGALDDAAWDLLGAVDPAPLTVRADATLEARRLAQVLARLSAMGHADVELVIRTP
ncbi:MULTISPECIES: biopolymer transporter ExbD [unclassified Sulfitobacter]|jgi:biopolymer transport protein ExbD|uniref:ExbD/TolR family protein n=1 Tax=unclassified Sulfitobacter TaxID=196795 RepID=UPI001593F27E|nr:biopolymer transporter ExbD [Sulfitobacter sp. HGT1]